MMTLVAVVEGFDGEHDVMVDGRWVGRVFVQRGEWAAQDFDGDVDSGFLTMLGAASHVWDLSGGMTQ